ncbi:MAG: UTP--glucose-1-phosphate uridylyltransferase [Acidobacteria bacterium]|nr:UTP--glucose-1-phosphate uridylyltransferase [Acidobacteriota bacterium]
MKLLERITSPDPSVRNLSFDSWADGQPENELLAEAVRLESFRRESQNLYDRVRALIFLATLHRFQLGAAATGTALIPYGAVEHIRARRFDQAVSELLALQQRHGASPALSSALAAAYRGLAFQTLADQVRRSVREFPGNRWMFRAGHVFDYPLRLHPDLLAGDSHPVLHEITPVRMDLTHGAWSDIFFLAMDYPEGARVINISVDLAVRGSGASPRPPVESFFRIIDEPVIRLVSVDLGASADIASLDELFDFARDYLGLLKAAVIASGLIPSGLEGSGQPLPTVLERLTGRSGLGIEIVSQVNDIPKGSRFAVSTNLLACLIAVCMRATRQIRSLTGPLDEDDRRIVAARAILGEWLGGSGGGWQDSGGVWPGVKLIAAEAASEGDPEFGISRGRLLPRHRLLDEVTPEAHRRLEESLVLVHGGMSQDVGPILEMCTERYLLRSGREWEGRKEAVALLDQLAGALQEGDIKRLGQLTQSNYDGPIQTIIPWAGNAYTERLIAACRAEFGDEFWGFWMLGGMSGGGMGFVFDPAAKPRALARMPEILATAKRSMETSFPFAVEPVVYDFSVNDRGSTAELRTESDAILSVPYYLLRAPALLRTEPRLLPAAQRAELIRFARVHRDQTDTLFDRMMPRDDSPATASGASLQDILTENGFDAAAHELLRAEYRARRVGLAQNRLPASTVIEDVRREHVGPAVDTHETVGRQALRDGKLAMITMAGGAGSRWTKGAGVVKALHPFHRFNSHYFSFLDIQARKAAAARVPHIVTASYLTAGPILASGARVSRGRSIGLRMIPTVADLRYLWEVMPQQQLDAQKQKVRESARASLLNWVVQTGEASDYLDNLPSQCVHPVGHWYELPNLLRNGTLKQLLDERPALQYLFLHNIDTLGAEVSAAALGQHIAGGAAMTVEVIGRQFEDHGGGLALVNGRPRLVEGLCLPNEEIEFSLSYYNTGSYWITIDALLKAFGLTRATLGEEGAVHAAVRRMAQRMPSYITIKEVKKRWGRGQEDIFPVAQFERLWGDMTALEELPCAYVEVPRRRGQQLKDVSQLDAWVRDGSAADIERLLRAE